MSEIENLIDHINFISGDDAEFIIRAAKKYADLKLEEFKNSKDYLQLVQDSKWLYYLKCAGVDNWEGYNIAIDLKEENEHE